MRGDGRAEALRGGGDFRFAAPGRHHIGVAIWAVRGPKRTLVVYDLIVCWILKRQDRHLIIEYSEYSYLVLRSSCNSLSVRPESS
jgi:hypothetical protein